jgi:hypothetical protein
VKWDTGERSRIKLKLSTTSLSGVVKRGAFAGDTIVANVQITPTKGDCVNTPMTEASVKGSMSF